jgi:voltage-gated potassium channel
MAGAHHDAATLGGGADREDCDGERRALLAMLERWLDPFMLLLGVAWLVLLVVELAWGLTPFLIATGTVIWMIFVLDFVLRFALAPRKGEYLRSSWLTALSLLVPALRVLRIARAVRVLRLARATRGLRLVRVLAAINRGLGALGATMSRRGLGYVLAATLVVLTAGAAGMYAFEGARGGLDDYGSALWWTAMILTTMGSERWPVTAEGRLLCLFLAVYAFAVFGYLTAALASHFVGRDAERPDGELAGQASIDRLAGEIAALRGEIRGALAAAPSPAERPRPPGG